MISSSALDSAALTVCLIRIPVRLRSVSSRQNILNRQSVKVLSLCQRANNIPAEAIDIDPFALIRVSLGQIVQQLQYALIVVEGKIEVVRIRVEFDHGDVALRLQMRY